MRERTKLGSVAARLSLFFGVAVVAICIAQVIGLSLSISKTVLQFDNLPGTAGEASFIVRNNDAQQVAVRIRLVDWEDTPDGRTLLSPANSLSRSCASWVQYAPRSFDLLPGQEQEVHVTITATTYASGTYWAAFLVDTPENSTVAANGIRATAQFLIKLYQTSLPAATSGKIVDVKVAGLSPLGIALTFVNTGETLMQHVRATATLQDRAGHKLGQISSDPFSVLPDHSIDITLTTSIDMQIPGIYLVTGIVDFGADFVVAGQVSFQVKPLSLTPIGSSTNPPQDLDDDGLYEDINGDGRLTADDLSLFETHLDDSCIAKNVRAFDYNNDGKIAQDDVDELRNMLARQSQISGD